VSAISQPNPIPHTATVTDAVTLTFCGRTDTSTAPRSPVTTIASLRSSQLVASDHAVRSKGFPRDLGAVAVRHRAAGIRNDYPSDA
jgi:hypothetical protein